MLKQNTTSESLSGIFSTGHLVTTQQLSQAPHLQSHFPRKVTSGGECAPDTHHTEENKTQGKILSIPFSIIPLSRNFCAAILETLDRNFLYPISNYTHTAASCTLRVHILPCTL